MKKLAHQRPARPRYEDAPAVDLNVLAGKPSVNFTHDATAPRTTEPARERVEIIDAGGKRVPRWKCRCGHLCKFEKSLCPACEKARSALRRWHA